VLHNHRVLHKHRDEEDTMQSSFRKQKSRSLLTTKTDEEDEDGGTESSTDPSYTEDDVEKRPHKNKVAA